LQKKPPGSDFSLRAVVFFNVYLMREGQLHSQDIDDLLNKQSGLLGISGISGDMREMLASVKKGHPRASWRTCTVCGPASEPW
jgi:acetate kinase